MASTMGKLDARDVLPIEIILSCPICIKYDCQIGHAEFYGEKTYEQLEKELATHQYENHIGVGTDALGQLIEASQS